MSDLGRGVGLVAVELGVSEEGALWVDREGNVSSSSWIWREINEWR